MNNRNNTLDEIAGFLVIYMIVYHVMQWSGMQDSKAMQAMSFLNFFMPWFFFKGGMLFKPKASNAMLSSSAKRLIKPFIIWSLVGVIVFGVISCFIHHTHDIGEYLKMNVYQLLSEGSVPGNQPLWFLVALFFARIVANENVRRNISIIYPTVIGILISTLLHFSGLQLPRYFTYIASGVFFFGIGILLSDKVKNDRLKALSIFIYLGLSVISKPVVDFRANTLLEGYYLLWPIWSIAGIITINTIFEGFHKAFRKPLPILSFIGRESMLFYTIHWPVIMIVFRILLNN